jgi:hypothetical protein
MTKQGKMPQIGDLPRMNAQQLQAVHRELFGTEHAIANCQHLRRKIAWHLQAAKDGSLPESARQYAIAIARGTELRLRISENAARRLAQIPLDQTATTAVVQTGDARLPMPGSLIVKTYKAETIVVKVLIDGFEYDGRRFSSLSAIAGEITGTHWNGFVFFGLEKEARHAR